VAIVLALCAALAFGVTDFSAGVASRRLSAGPVTAVLQALGLLTAGVGVLVLPGVGPRPAALGFGALSGLGSTIGSLSLYHGMTKGRMAIVATLSAVLTAVLPVLFGLTLGQPLSVLAAVGIVVSIPAIALVSWQADTADKSATSSGAGYGLLSGAGFAVLFIALDRAGTRSGAWPLIPGQAVALLSVLPFAHRHEARLNDLSLQLGGLIFATGVISAVANLLFLAATGRGDLAIVAVLSAMYPAITVLLARFILTEKTTVPQSLGLAAAAVAVVLVTIG
jgi:drug/metabolite transporter (DMT)-like permease